MSALPVVLLAFLSGHAQGHESNVLHESKHHPVGGDFLAPEVMERRIGKVVNWETLPVLVSPMVAVVGYFVKSIMEARGRARRIQLERVSQQIEHFYGPISALSHRGKTAFNSMLKVYARHVGVEASTENGIVTRLMQELSREQTKPGSEATKSPAVQLWIEFVRNIAYPVNSNIVKILTEKSHLHDGPLPPDYLDLFGLVAERSMVISQWQHGDYSQLLFDTLYPSAFDEAIENRLRELQEKQVRLEGVSITFPNPLQTKKKPERRTSSKGASERHTLTDDMTDEMRPLKSGPNDSARLPQSS